MFGNSYFAGTYFGDAWFPPGVVTTTTKGRRPQRIPFTIASGPRTDLLEVLAAFPVDLAAESVTAYQSAAVLTVETELRAESLARVLTAAVLGLERGMVAESRIRCEPSGRMGIVTPQERELEARLARMAIQVEYAEEEEWLLGLR